MEYFSCLSCQSIYEVSSDKTAPLAFISGTVLIENGDNRTGIEVRPRKVRSRCSGMSDRKCIPLVETVAMKSAIWDFRVSDQSLCRRSVEKISERGGLRLLRLPMWPDKGRIETNLT